jgi:hypothetical protein
MLDDVMVSAVMLNVVMVSVVMLNVIMPSVMAPHQHSCTCLASLDRATTTRYILVTMFWSQCKHKGMPVLLAFSSR